MEAKDLIVTPLIAIVLYLIAYWIRPFVTNSLTKKYFIPALTLKFTGALAIGLVYQFYYDGGDTFGFTTYGSSYIWEAFNTDPTVAFKLIFYDNELRPDTFQYASRIWYFNDAPAYFVVRIAAIFGLITFDTYSSVALFFAVLGFSGMWAIYSSLVKIYPSICLQLAITFFAIPSVVFWGSGVMKDTLTLSAVGWVTYGVLQLLIFKKRGIGYFLIIAMSIWVIYTIKIYILICLLPALLIWGFLSYMKKIKSLLLRYLLQPIFFSVPLLISVYGLTYMTQGNERYAFDTLLNTAEITALDNSQWTVRAEGSAYSLGDYDFSPTGLIRKFIPAVWLTLFRPYLWEVNSAVMILSALESLVLFFFTLFLVFKSGILNFIKQVTTQPIIVMCLLFTISFAFAVGISSGNFGSLVRYKIPIMPFFVSALFILQFHSKRSNVLPKKIIARNLPY